MQLTFLLYPGIEPIDLAPLGVFSMGRRVVPELSYRTAAPTPNVLVELSNGLKVMPDVSFGDIEDMDVLLVPGGPGWKEAASDPQVIDFIRRWAPGATICSVCTGAMILAAAGVLDGMAATTKNLVIPPEPSVMEELKQRYPQVSATEALLVDNKSVITGGGVTLCIDTALYLIASRYGEEAADEIARIMEYGAARKANAERMPLVVSDTSAPA
ncbi:DJ-1/PfpI family protein [Pusillimonas caeni]|uniref:DJ-1/PfpI family protein n=1 Tax=Pusillimonas caeni TaxID=1348472 RepID=UPI000E599117|nr:DJ-1/PfpI family protein [Pusillimonas caeni]